MTVGADSITVSAGFFFNQNCTRYIDYSGAPSWSFSLSPLFTVKPVSGIYLFYGYARVVVYYSSMYFVGNFPPELGFDCWFVM